jgi:lysophospholipase L1-like esterase
MKILFFGDSITDMGRARDRDDVFMGNGYVFFVAGDVKKDNPSVQIINRGISGDRVVDLYARIKSDVWNNQPDVLSILIGINDLWSEAKRQDGVDLKRYIKVYDMLIADTLEKLPNVKIVLLEPFVLNGQATADNYEYFLQIKEYAKAVKELAKKYSLDFIPLQEAFDKASQKTCVEDYLYDGVHPNVAGARLIADEWMKFYNEKLK